MSQNNKRTILLMRHAKSSWDQPGMRDFDRPLNNRGKRDAPRMGLFLFNKSTMPERIISSPAIRAKDTAYRIVEAMKLPPEKIEWDDTLYFTGPMSYVDVIKKSPDQISTVMTVGHNPMTDEVISMLAKTPVHKHIATATIACLSVQLQSWNELAFHTCNVEWVVAPKEIKD